MPAQYVFTDEWDVDAPIEAVFTALADARTYPECGSRCTLRWTPTVHPSWAACLVSSLRVGCLIIFA